MRYEGTDPHAQVGSIFVTYGAAQYEFASASTWFAIDGILDVMPCVDVIVISQSTFPLGCLFHSGLCIT